MVFHGALVIIVGLLAGFPFAFLLTGDMQAGPAGMPEALRAWKMAHLEGILNGLLVLAVAGVGKRLTLSAGRQKLLSGSLIIMAWANVIASIVGAASGSRGLAAGGSLANNVVFLLFTAAIIAVFVAMGLVVLGSYRPRAGAGGR